MRQSYQVTLNGRKIMVKASSWWQAFTLTMVGRSSVPISLVIRPIKRTLQ